MRDAKIDLLTQLKQLREQMPEDDERIIVIDELIRDKTRRSEAEAASAELNRAASSPSMELIAVSAQPADLTSQSAAPQEPRASAMHRFPSREVVYFTAPAKSRGLAAVCGLVGAIALVTAVAVLGLAGLVTHPQRTASLNPASATSSSTR